MGPIPFTKQVLWECLAEEEARAKSATKIGVTIAPYSSLVIADAIPRHHSSAQLWEGGMFDKDPQIAIQASAEARATKRKDDTQAAAQREKQKTVTALLKDQTDAVAAIARLDNECEGDVDRLHIPELVAIIGNKTFQMPKTGQKRDYYRVIVKDLLGDSHGARDFNAGMLEVQAPTEDDWEEEGIIERE